MRGEGKGRPPSAAPGLNPGYVYGSRKCREMTAQKQRLSEPEFVVASVPCARVYAMFSGPRGAR